MRLFTFKNSVGNLERWKQWFDVCCYLCKRLFLLLKLVHFFYGKIQAFFQNIQHALFQMPLTSFSFMLSAVKMFKSKHRGLSSPSIWMFVNQTERRFVSHFLHLGSLHAVSLPVIASLSLFEPISLPPSLHLSPLKNLSITAWDASSK